MLKWEIVLKKDLLAQGRRTTRNHSASTGTDHDTLKRRIRARQRKARRVEVGKWVEQGDRAAGDDNRISVGDCRQRQRQKKSGDPSNVAKRFPHVRPPGRVARNLSTRP